MRQSWIDDRLDDLSHRMDERFDRVDRDIDELRKDNREMRVEIGALQRTMLQVGGSLIVAVLGLTISQL